MLQLKGGVKVIWILHLSDIHIGNTYKDPISIAYKNSD